MMFEEEYCQAQQTLINNGTTTPEDHKIPIKVLETIGTALEEEEQRKCSIRFSTKIKGIHALSNQITTLINKA